MPLDNSVIKNILVVSMTNIGDVILSFPVVDVLKHKFPKSALSIIVGPKAHSIFSGNPYFKKVFVFNKRQNGIEKIKWILQLRQQKFDLIIDLRHTAIPFLLGAKYRTPLFSFGARKGVHRKEKHLDRMRMLVPEESGIGEKICVVSSQKDKEVVEQLIRPYHLDRFVIFIPGAADHRKQWPAEYYGALADLIIRRDKVKVVLVGGLEDKKITESVEQHMKESCVNLCGQLTLLQLAELMGRSMMVVGNDTGPMHLASYLDRTVIVLFGPTNPLHYGPWSQHGQYFQNNQDCLGCKAHDKDAEHSCMSRVTPEQVLKSFRIESFKISFL